MIPFLEDINKVPDSGCGFVSQLTSCLRGRPRYDIPEEHLEYLLNIGFSCPGIADVLGVSLSTVRRRMTEFGLSVTALYSKITDYELDTLVREIMEEYPNCGYCLMHGHLLHRGHRVIQARIRDTMHRVDPQGVAIRWNSSIQRRKYTVTSPLSLWHLDGNHKLIRYGNNTKITNTCNIAVLYLLAIEELHTRVILRCFHSNAYRPPCLRAK